MASINRAAKHALAAALLASPATALGQADAWSRMAEEDLEAARSFLEETHPGAVSAQSDLVFIGQMVRGYSEAQALARQARTFGGYRAALQRFAAAFDDPHIASTSWVQQDRYWPGFLVSSRRGGWKVVPGGSTDGPQSGAELVSCDGKAPEALATEALSRFTSAWNVAAQRMRTSSDLLIDSGNPHQSRAVSCDFRGPDGKLETHRLSWRRISSADLAKQFAHMGPFVSNEVGLRAFDGGWWIRLGTLSGAALPLMKEVEARQAELRAVPFVILDLRGNDGGASFFSDRIAEVIYGTARVDAALHGSKGRGAEKVVWRASPTTLKTAEALIERTARIGGAEHPIALAAVAQRDAIRAAIEAGIPLAEAPAAIDGRGDLRKRDKVKPLPRVILITDRICFSSCLLAARLFRELGATHVGQETSANTRYSNAISTDLPSGLSTFSSLQAYWTHVPRQLGPYAPAVPLKVDLADEQAVEGEVRKLIAASLKRR